ncbi:hypothetical protein [Sinomicrobium sp. M5D2P17]
MKRKIKRIISYSLSVIFLFALITNIKISLDNPFSLLSNDAIAQATSSSGDSGPGGTSDDGSCPKVSYKSENKSTYNEFVPYNGELCLIVTYEKVEILCMGNGTVACCPAIKSFKIVGTTFGACPGTSSTSG